MENEDNCRITYIYGLYEVGKEDEIRYIGKTFSPKERFRSSPSSTYKESWTSWMSFFDRVEKNIRYDYLSYNDAKELLKENKLNKFIDFKKFIKGKSKEYRIPSHPESHYIEWSGWGDFLN